MATKALDCFPRLICWAKAWTISADCRKRWKLTSTKMAEAVGRRQGVDRADGCQRVVATGVGRLPIGLAGDLQAPFDVEDGQPPVLLAAHLGDLAEGVVMLVGLDPQAGETGGNVFRQPLC